MGEWASVVPRSRRGRPRFLCGCLGVVSEKEVGEEGDSRLSARGEREGERWACCGASPQSEGVLDEVCVSGEKQAEPFASSVVGLSEKPEGYCSPCPKGVGLNVGRNAGLFFVVAMPVAGKVGLKKPFDLDEKEDVVSTDVSGRSKKDSVSRKEFSE